MLARHERSVAQVVRRRVRGVAGGEDRRHRGNAQIAVDHQPAGTIALSLDLRGEWTRAKAGRPDHGRALDELPVAQGDAALIQR